jgi:hypothetical protein
MAGTGGSDASGVQAARARAQAVLHLRGRALAVAVLPAAAAAVLIGGGVTGRLGAAGAPDAAGWNAARWAVSAVAVVVLLLTAAFALAVRRAERPQVPAVPLAEHEAPELYRLVRELAERMEVPAPERIALTPDCDSWLEDPPDHPARRRRGPADPLGETTTGDTIGGGAGTDPVAPTLVIGSPFIWWMRVAELRALLAPVVAGTACSADPDIAAARRFVRGLDAALGLATDRGTGPAWRRPALLLLGRTAALLLRRSRGHASEMERAVAGWASEQARQVDYGLRISAQEQVGLAYAGWDRLLTRVALPAWRIGRWPGRLDAGVVSALTELSRRDRLAEGFGNRLGERPACDLLEEPGRIDEALSLLAARLFCSRAEAASADWSPVDWDEYPQAVVERIWRTRAAELDAALGSAEPIDLAQVLDRLALGGGADLADRLTALAVPAAETGGWPPPRTGRDLLGEHLTALVCCAALDAGVAEAGLDWLDGPALTVDGVRRTDLGSPVALAVEHGDDAPLRAWLDDIGIRTEKPVRLS